MGLVDKAIAFSIKKNLAKWLAGAGTAAVSVASPYIAKHLGVELTPEQQQAMAVTVGALIVGATNFMKQHLLPQYAKYIP